MITAARSSIRNQRVRDALTTAGGTPRATLTDKKTQEQDHPKNHHSDQGQNAYHDAAQAAVAFFFSFERVAGAARAVLFRSEVGLFAYRTAFKFHLFKHNRKMPLRLASVFV